jgi:hypothetical protein
MSYIRMCGPIYISNHSIFPRQDRPHCKLEFKLNHGADEQVGSVHS